MKMRYFSNFSRNSYYLLDKKFIRKMSNIIWADCEMTGLSPEKDKILEIATIVTDKDLNIVAEGPSIVIHQPESVLDTMNEVVSQMHSKSGLTDQVRKSKISLEEAERMTLEFVKKHTEKGKSGLAGNSIGQDYSFISKYMPSLKDYLNYRVIDVSSVKELCVRWNPKLSNDLPIKKQNHRALDDIKESIQELMYYKKHFFKLK